MKRRKVLQQIGALAAMTVGANTVVTATEPHRPAPAAKKPVLRIAHITDVHIRNGDKAPERFTKSLRDIRNMEVDLILNGGDSIHDASYDHVKRESVTEQWGLWDQCLAALGGIEVYSCIGNHDPWWAAPARTDEFYGKPYVVKRLKIPHRYYSFSKKNWHFIILDGNNEKISLDEEQYRWLEKELASLKAGTPTLLMSHYPILGTTPMLVGGGHSDHKKLKDLFYQHRDKVRICLSGHNHLFDKTFYNGVWYCCNGAMSGYWWGKGDKESAGPGYYLETPPGYTMLELFEDGTLTNEYLPQPFV